MKTKLTKVSVADRLPSESGNYLARVKGYKNFEIYYFDLADRDFLTFYIIEEWLEETPEYTDELVDALKLALNRLKNTTEYEIVDFYKEDCEIIESLLTKIKTS